MTHFGIALPPWKPEKLGAGSTTIVFMLTGNIISKKNNESAFAVRKPSIDFLYSKQQNGMVTIADAVKAVMMVKAKIIGNIKYKKFLESKKPVVQHQMDVWRERLGNKGLTFPLPKSAVSIRLYIKDRYRRDTVNAQQTIYDLLKDCHVISDDDDTHVNPNFSESGRFFDEIIYNIAKISISFKL